VRPQYIFTGQKHYPYSIRIRKNGKIVESDVCIISVSENIYLRIHIRAPLLCSQSNIIWTSKGAVTLLLEGIWCRVPESGYNEKKISCEQQHSYMAGSKLVLSVTLLTRW